MNHSIVLSNPPGAIAASLPQTEYNGSLDVKNKWKKWRAKDIFETQENLKQTQNRYKQNFDMHYWKTEKQFNLSIALSFESNSKTRIKTRHKLAPITDGPFQDLHAYKSSRTVVIKRLDKSIENISRSRFPISTKFDHDKCNNKETIPKPIHSTISSYPLAVKTILRHIVDT